MDYRLVVKNNLLNSLDPEKKYDVLLLEDRIVENIIYAGVTIDVEDIWKIKEANMRLVPDQKYGILVTSHYLAEITKEARELGASKDFSMNTVAKALLVESTGHRIVGNFYITVNKPVIKTKIFSDRGKAMDWLRKQLEEADQATLKVIH